MKRETVVFIGFQEQDNLGIGYMASALQDENYAVRIIDFRIGNQQILESLVRLNPLAVGFSIIFQHYIDQFRDLIGYLREKGIECHFCAGGHYPSLRPAELLKAVPELSSVVLFEGEWTFLELVKMLSSDAEWRGIKGIAYHENGSVIINPFRPLENDLDNFTPPLRPPLKEYAFGKKFATILAGRGCIHNCSFCSIHEFYSRPPGGIKRVRLPKMVVREMELLHLEQSCSIFMFQDDDFPLIYEKKKNWITEFCDAMDSTGLSDKVIWKINCRPDEVSSELFSLMKKHGLFLVYLGIESGTDSGLKLMDKHISVNTNHEAVRILKELDILFDYGFMLFDPESTFETVEENLLFLKNLCGDGSSPVTFCKMLPYAETKIEKILETQGRLKGTGSLLDYDFKDHRVDLLYEFMAECFSDWIGEHEGLLNLARWTRYFIVVHEKYYQVSSQFKDLKTQVNNLVALSNKAFFDYSAKMVNIFKSPDNELFYTDKLTLQNEINSFHSLYCEKFNDLIDKIHSVHQ